MRTDLLRGQLDALLLAVLAEGPRHGYAIVEELRGRTAGELELAEGTLYPALHRLERDGLLESRWSTDAPRRRRVYAVTARGRAALEDRRHEWRGFVRAVGAVLDPA
jgi:PadR family transcriptional regulator, regulatory protein PadR